MAKKWKQKKERKDREQRERIGRDMERARVLASCTRDELLAACMAAGVFGSATGTDDMSMEERIAAERESARRQAVDDIMHRIAVGQSVIRIRADGAEEAGTLRYPEEWVAVHLAAPGPDADRVWRLFAEGFKAGALAASGSDLPSLMRGLADLDGQLSKLWASYRRLDDGDREALREADRRADDFMRRLWGIDGAIVSEADVHDIMRQSGIERRKAEEEALRIEAERLAREKEEKE